MPRRSTVVPYQWPRRVDRLEDCEFYHSIELPGFGLQTGHWDLRNDVEPYLGNQPFGGKTVIDVGTGSGFLCFEMEKRGANVIAFDFDGGLVNRQHDITPFHDFEKRFGDYNEFFQRLTTGLDRMKNSYWLTHHLLKSKARVFYGNVYDCEVDFGPVDYVFFGNILLHLMSPVAALNTFAPRAAEKVIVTEACFHETYNYESNDPVCWLTASPQQKDAFASWWQITPGFLKQYLGVHGFTKFDLSFHKAQWVGQGQNVNRDIRHFTLVASR